jgi:hypothetical protein
VAQYRAWARQYALADRYFQPLSGASSSNDMYFATARYLFTDNTWEPAAIGAGCWYNQSTIQYSQITLADLLAARGQQLTWYAEGYRSMVDSSICPSTPEDCTSAYYFPCIYDPGDVPAAYFASSADRPTRMRDYAQLGHPGYGTTISAGVDFVARTVRDIEQSRYAADTLVLVTWDESGVSITSRRRRPAASTASLMARGRAAARHRPVREEGLRLARHPGALVDREVHRVELARRHRPPARARRGGEQPRQHARPGAHRPRALSVRAAFPRRHSCGPCGSLRAALNLFAMDGSFVCSIALRPIANGMLHTEGISPDKTKIELRHHRKTRSSIRDLVCAP